MTEMKIISRVHKKKKIHHTHLVLAQFNLNIIGTLFILPGAQYHLYIFLYTNRPYVIYVCTYLRQLSFLFQSTKYGSSL